MLSQQETLKILKKYSIPCAKSEIGTKSRILGTRLKFPLAVKIASEEVVHKTDVGGVAVGIRDTKELADALNSIEKKVRLKYPNAALAYMAQEMVPGIEIIIGMKRDAQFGPVILFGLGGVLVEIFKDVSMRIAPLSSKDIGDMMGEIKASQLLNGYRGQKVNTAAVADILKKTSALAVRERHIAEIDFNPVIAGEKNALVVDARIIENDS